MPSHLLVTLALSPDNDGTYTATVSTTVTDTCYSPVGISHGLPDGWTGLPEMAYVIAAFTHEGDQCGQIVHVETQQIGGIRADGHSMGVTAFVTVNGQVVGTAHKDFLSGI